MGTGAYESVQKSHSDAHLPKAKKTFSAYKKQGAKAGACLFLSTHRFQTSFPTSNLFPRVETRGVYPPAAIRSCLDGHIVILNIQHVGFKGTTLVPQEGDGGHNICCVGYDDTSFVLHDSNTYRALSQDTPASTLQDGYDTHAMRVTI